MPCGTSTKEICSAFEPIGQLGRIALQDHQIRRQPGDRFRIRFDVGPDLGKLLHLGRKIAEARNPDHLATQPEGEKSLGNTWRSRDNPVPAGFRRQPRGHREGYDSGDKLRVCLIMPPFSVLFRKPSEKKPNVAHMTA